MEMRKIVIAVALVLAGCEDTSVDPSNEAAPVATNMVEEPDPYNRTAEELVAAYEEHVEFSKRSCEDQPDTVIKLSGRGMSEERRQQSIRGCLNEMKSSRADLVKEGLIAPDLAKARNMVTERTKRQR